MWANAFSFLELVKEGVGNSKKCRKLEPGGKAALGVVEQSSRHGRVESQTLYSQVPVSASRCNPPVALLSTTGF